MSIFIVSVALIPLMGLIPVGLKNAQISSEETHAVHLLSAVVQDLKYTKSSSEKSYLFKIDQTPYRTVKEGTVNRVWIDSFWNVYSQKKTNGMYYELEWEYTQVPDINSFLPVIGRFTVKWPPPKKSENNSNKAGEVSVLIAFKKAP